MRSIQTCAVCKGKGKTPVYNAYDPKDVQWDVCDGCGGTGVLDEEDTVKFSRYKKEVETDDYN